jgi:hypothetical protein
MSTDDVPRKHIPTGILVSPSDKVRHPRRPPLKRPPLRWHSSRRRGLRIMAYGGGAFAVIVPGLLAIGFFATRHESEQASLAVEPTPPTVASIEPTREVPRIAAPIPPFVSRESKAAPTLPEATHFFFPTTPPRAASSIQAKSPTLQIVRSGTPAPVSRKRSETPQILWKTWVTSIECGKGEIGKSRISLFLRLFVPGPLKWGSGGRWFESSHPD